MTSAAHTLNDTPFWMSDDTNLIPSGPLRSPDRAIMLVNEASTDDGVTFEAPVFEEGVVNAVVALVPTDMSSTLFDKMASALPRKKVAEELLDSFAEAGVALWNIDDANSLMMIVDTKTSVAEDLWYDICRFAGLPPYEEDRVVAKQGFSWSAVEASSLAPILVQLRPASKPSL